MEKLKSRREERKEIIKKIGSNPVVTGKIEMYKSQALSSLIEELEDSINKQAKSTNCLSWVLTISTFIMATVSIVNLYLQFYPKK